MISQSTSAHQATGRGIDPAGLPAQCTDDVARAGCLFVATVVDGRPIAVGGLSAQRRHGVIGDLVSLGFGRIIGSPDMRQFVGKQSPPGRGAGAAQPPVLWQAGVGTDGRNCRFHCR